MPYWFIINLLKSAFRSIKRAKKEVIFAIFFLQFLQFLKFVPINFLKTKNGHLGYSLPSTHHTRNWKFSFGCTQTELCETKFANHSGFPCVSFKFENDMPENTYKPKNCKLYTTFGGFKPLPRISGIFGHFFYFCRLFLPSYLINPRTQNHSFPSWAI